MDSLNLAGKYAPVCMAEHRIAGKVSVGSSHSNILTP